MTKLDDLIAELCPDGVEYRKLGEICTIVRGASPRPISSYITNDDTGVNWIKIGDSKIGSKFIESTVEKITEDGANKSRRVKPGDFILSNSMSFGRPYILKINGCIHDGWISLSNYEKSVLSDYLYYILVTSDVQHQMKRQANFGGGIQNLNIDIVKGITIPVPPLKIQEEIVHILDTFSELQAELQDRKEQYEYYRNTLIWSPIVENKDFVLLKDIAEYSSNRIPANIMDSTNYVGVDNLLPSKLGKTNSNYVPSNGNVIGYNPNDILIGNIRPYLRKIWLSNINGGTNGDVLVIRITDTCRALPSYIYHVLSSENFFVYITEHSKGAKMPRGDKKAVMEFRFPLPPIPEQQRIISILDRFDSLCNDLTQGLPAEIKSRRKQYEYYRDRLLTFKELGALA